MRAHPEWLQFCRAVADGNACRHSDRDAHRHACGDRDGNADSDAGGHAHSDAAAFADAAPHRNTFADGSIHTYSYTLFGGGPGL